MSVSNKKEPTLLLLGDIVIFGVSLWLALAMRYLALPADGLFFLHLWPFLILFGVWLVTFYVAGMYEKHTLIFKSKLPQRIFKVQIVNVIIAILFFHLIPYFGITPKTILFIYLIISFALFVLWRMHGHHLIGSYKREKALLIGTGEEMYELEKEITDNNRYGMDVASVLDLESVQTKDFHKEVINRVYSAGISVVIIDIRSDKVQTILSHLYRLMFSQIKFIDLHKAYEDIFDRIPLSLIKDGWFIENISLQPKLLYDAFKRTIDIVLSVIFGIISIPILFVAAIMIKIEDRGPIFYVTKRLGKNNKLIHLYKLRTMTSRDTGAEALEVNQSVTRVGRYFRKLHIDELPQFWNIFKGDISLIGPRPEIPTLAEVYEQEVPYYNVRHLIKPGISGWAQLYHVTPPKFGLDKTGEQTKKKLSYDLYYIKNRSIGVDIKIILRTITKVLSGSGI